MTLWTLTIPDYVPAPLNKLMRGTIRQRIRLGKADRELVAHYFRESGIPKAVGKRRVGVAVSMRGNLMDPDSPLKGLFDCLTACGAIVDDSAEYLEIGRVSVVRGDRQTIVTLEEV